MLLASTDLYIGALGYHENFCIALGYKEQRRCASGIRNADIIAADCERVQIRSENTLLRVDCTEVGVPTEREQSVDLVVAIFCPILFKR